MSVNDPPDPSQKSRKPRIIAILTDSRLTSVDEALKSEDFYSRFLRICRKISRRSMDPQDLVQDTVVRMIEKKEQYQGESSLEGWAYRIAKNRHIDVMRQENVRSQKERFIKQTGRSDENGLHKIALKEAVAKLSSQQRQILKLRKVDGVSVEVIAKTLGFPSAKKVYQELEKIERALDKAIDGLEY